MASTKKMQVRARKVRQMARCNRLAGDQKNIVVPENVRSSITKFAGGEVVTVQHRKVGVTGRGKHGHCHFNVADLVSRFGGEAVFCWSLSTEGTRLGLWVWQFHSIWRTPEGKLVDVTSDSKLTGSTRIVCIDTQRKCDFEVGSSYNNVVIFETFEITTILGTTLRKRLFPSIPYWTTQGVNDFREQHEHSGKYLWLSPQYPNNLAAVESRYGLRFANGRLETVTGSQYVPRDAPFDFSLS